MRAVIQRVARAHVEVEGEVVGAIEQGLLVYLGLGEGDDDAVAQWMLSKILYLRVFENDAGKLDRSLLDVGGSLLVVSQFTLYGDVTRGRRPSFDGAMEPNPASALYARFVTAAKEHVKVATGRFRATMKVISENEGPLTLWLDSEGRV